eukprot:4553027-Amphidinium_carterae.1
MASQCKMLLLPGTPEASSSEVPDHLRGASMLLSMENAWHLDKTKLTSMLPFLSDAQKRSLSSTCVDATISPMLEHRR